MVRPVTAQELRGRIALAVVAETMLAAVGTFCWAAMCSAAFPNLGSPVSATIVVTVIVAGQGCGDILRSVRPEDFRNRMRRTWWAVAFFMASVSWFFLLPENRAIGFALATACEVALVVWLILNRKSFEYRWPRGASETDSDASVK